MVLVSQARRQQGQKRRASTAFSLEEIGWWVNEHHRQGQVGQDARAPDTTIRNNPEREVRKLAKQL